MLRHYQAPFALDFVEQSCQGPAAARNTGVTHATGSLLLFLDDDVEPTPNLIEAHVRAHQGGSDQVAMGPCPYPPALQNTRLLHMELQSWWEGAFQRVVQPSHRYAYSNCFSGNLSVEKDLFIRIGQFDSIFQVHEDYELGIRLLKAGVSLRAIPEAMAYHHEEINLQRVFRRRRDEGRADILLLRRHPELFESSLGARLGASLPLWARIVRILISRWSALGDALAKGLQPLLLAVERLRMRHLWRRLMKLLNYYWYWRGVADDPTIQEKGVGSLWDLQLKQGSDTPEIDLDLSQGLELTELRLDQDHPGRARILYNQSVVGHIPSGAGVEPLRGAHLRAFLAKDLAIPLLQTLALDKIISPTIDRLRLCESLKSMSFWFGRAEASEIWDEQYYQWARLGWLMRKRRRRRNSSLNG
jgi:GT2 family glycosyltransferase